MNSKFTTLAGTFTLAAVCLASSPFVRAQATPGQPGYQPVELARPELEPFRVSHLVGKPVRSANGEELSRIKDFLIDPKSGRVHYVVVEAGGNNFRIVPMSALQPGSGADGLVLSLDRARWDQVGTMSEQQLLSQVSIDAGQQQQMQQQFQLGSAEPAAQGLIRATLLNEREIRAGSDRIGVVDEVVIDFHNRIAAPYVRMDANFGGGQQNVLIHFPRLQVNPEPRSAILASLGRGDFRHLRSSQLSPTGYPGGMNAQGQGQAAATAVQQAIERDTSVPRGSVHAVPEVRIVLRGAVENDQKRTELERAAQQAAPNVHIDNQLMVRNR